MAAPINLFSLPSMPTGSQRSPPSIEISKLKASGSETRIHPTLLPGQHGSSDVLAAGTAIPPPSRQAPSPSKSASNTSTPSLQDGALEICACPRQRRDPYAVPPILWAGVNGLRLALPSFLTTCGYGSLRSQGRRCQFAPFKQHTLRVLAARYARALRSISYPLKRRGRRESRVRAAPAVSCAKMHEVSATRAYRFSGGIRLSLRSGLRIITRSPR